MLTTDSASAADGVGPLPPTAGSWRAARRALRIVPRPCEALTHVTQETAALLAALNDVAGPQSGALAAGGWTRMRSVRAAKSRVLPHVTFSTVAQPGALGAATFATFAAAGSPAPFLDFAAPLLTAARPADDPSHQARECIA